MSELLHADRNGCALHGALRVLEAIKGVVPIVHGNAGCALNAHYAANGLACSPGRHFRSAYETSATALHDKHVVFGGTSRLREQIKNTVKVLDGDLYVVATGCVPEVVGDDVPAMVKEAVEQRFPVLGVATPGFAGNAQQGYERTVRAVLEGIGELFETGGEARPELVNLLGLVPQQDPFWEGDLLALETLLGSLGLEANRLLGIGQDLKDWRNASRARLSLVVSPWGLEAARFLHQRHGVPYLHLGWLPVGGRDAGGLLDRLAEVLDLDEAKRENARRRLDRRFRYFLQKAAAVWLRHDLQRTVAIVAGSAYAVGVARFLAGTFGQQVAAVVLSDEPPEALREALVAAVHEVAPGAAVAFAASQDAIALQLLAAQPDLILGSQLEAILARQLGVPLLQLATPLRDSLVLNRSYVGGDGALALVEDFAAAALSAPSRGSPGAAGAGVAPGRPPRNHNRRNGSNDEQSE